MACDSMCSLSFTLLVKASSAGSSTRFSMSSGEMPVNDHTKAKRGEARRAPLNCRDQDRICRLRRVRPSLKSHKHEFVWLGSLAASPKCPCAVEAWYEPPNALVRGG